MTGPDRGVHPEDVRSAERLAGEDVDVLAVHRQAFREEREPLEGAERGPWWFWAAAVLALVFGGFYLGRYSGVFAGETAIHAPPGPQLPGGVVAGSGTAAAPAAAVNGQAVFESRCAACHQASGQGIPGAFPPLAGSEYVLGGEERVVRIVLHGLQGAVTVRGQTFNGAMPSWAGVLSDEQIAAVLTYVRSAWGNGAEAIDAEQVARQRSATTGRTTPWTAGELGR